MNIRRSPLFAESWNVAFRAKPTGTILSDTDAAFHVIPNAFRYWAADPFVVEREGKAYIFAELYDYILRRGVLGYCVIENGKPGKWIPVIQEEYHLSYPCLTEQDGQMYMMPESEAGKVLTVYQAVEFPNKWEKCPVLRSNVKFADTTPFPKTGMCLALTHQVEDQERPRLMLTDLRGTVDDRVIPEAVPFRSRPAGHVFAVDGKTVRPAQYSEDCGNGYGKGLIFYECELTEDLRYREREIGMLHPEDLRYDRPVFLDGMHTYNSSEHYEVIDIKTRRFNILNLIMRAAGKFLRR